VDWWWAMRLVVPPLLFLIVFWWFLARRQRLVRGLQERWSWLGSPQPYQGAGQRWSGEVDGRRVEVRWFEGNTELEVEARPLVAMGFGRKGQPEELASVPDASPLELDGKVGYSHDLAAVRAVARQPGVAEALSALLDAPDRSLRAVRVNPAGRVTWFARNLPERRLTREDTRQWALALLTVAHATEQDARHQTGPSAARQ
jgi:hypothetical protein